MQGHQKLQYSLRDENGNILVQHSFTKACWVVFLVLQERRTSYLLLPFPICSYLLVSNGAVCWAFHQVFTWYSMCHQTVRVAKSLACECTSSSWCSPSVAEQISFSTEAISSYFKPAKPFMKAASKRASQVGSLEVRRCSSKLAAPAGRDMGSAWLGKAQS